MTLQCPHIRMASSNTPTATCVCAPLSIKLYYCAEKQPNTVGTGRQDHYEPVLFEPLTPVWNIFNERPDGTLYEINRAMGRKQIARE